MDVKPAAVTFEETENASAVKNQGKHALQDIAFGSVAGIAGKYLEYPFDTVKVRLQSQPQGVQIYTGPLDCFRQSISNDGFWSLYRGISAPLFGAAVETSSLFFSYRLCQSAFQATLYTNDVDHLPLKALVACGAASGAFTSLLLTPIELIKCKMQVPIQEGGSTIQKPGPITLISSVLRHHGFLGFWHGQMGTLIRETGGSAAWFGSFEGVSLFFRKARANHTGVTADAEVPVKIWQQLIAGATAGMSYNFMFYPADTIKSRMQTEDVSKGISGTRKGFFEVGKTLWRDQGLKGMYRGCGITVARSAPSSAIIFTIYEALKNSFA